MRQSTLESYVTGLQRRAFRCEDRIRSTLDAFADLHPELIPRSGEGRRSLYAAARFVVEEVGEEQAPAFLRWADRKMVEKQMWPKSPRSYGWLFGEWRKMGGGDYEMRGRYLEGGLAE